MDESLTKILYEKLLILFMFKEEDVRDKLVPYLDPNVFSNHLNAQLVKKVLKFIIEHEHFPKVDELKLFIKETEIYNHLLDVLDTDASNYDKTFILKELEEFYRKSMLFNLLAESGENLSNPTSMLQDFPDKMREALGFNFSDDVGLDFLESSERIYDALHDTSKVVATGIETIDKLTKGGAHEKTLNVAIAGTHVGKSLFLCSITSSMLMNNKNVLYVSLEMSEEKVSERILANILDVELDNLCMIPKDKFIKMVDNIKHMISTKLVIIQKPAKTVSANKLRSILKELKTKKGFVPDVVCVDYMGLMCSNNASKDANSYSEQKGISEELRGLMVEQKLICWTGAQTNREGLKTAEVEMTDISESIGVTFTADFILGISTNEELKAAGRYNVKILKNRYGQSGFKIFVGVDYPKMRVYDLESEMNKKPQEKLIDDAAVEVLSTLGSNRKAKIKKVLEIE
jgi:archaellum biogenesis ATPase FlaH